MSAESARLRYLTDAVSTATPAQRIVMLYDRFALDLERAAVAVEATAADEFSFRGHVEHIRHAQQIVAELRATLDLRTWSGAENLASIYGYLLRELIQAHAEPQADRIRALSRIVTDLRESWNAAGEQLAQETGTPARVPATSGAWVG